MGTAARTAPAPVGRISTVAVRRDRLWVGWEGLAGRWLAALRRRVLQPPGSSSRRIPGSREMTAAAPSPAAPRPPLLAGGGGAGARRGTGPLAPGATVNRGGLSSVRPDRVAPPGGEGHARRPGSAAMSATHPTRLVTRTKESNTCASQRLERKPVAQ